MNRRNFLNGLSLSGLGLAGFPLLSHAQQSKIIQTDLPKDLTVLFQGDSITDAHRDRARYYASDDGGFGSGYVYQICARLLGKNPTSELKLYNRGISGNKVFQLADRWEEDCIQLQPDILSILIGVNDFWHYLEGRYNGTPEIYKNDFRTLLDRTIKHFPEIKLIICEPFAVSGGFAVKDEKWTAEFPEYRRIAASIATDYKAAFIPYQQVFDKALEVAPAAYWCPDGVHPSVAGAYLMAEEWLKTFFNVLS
ncbi:MAG: SGNH/GDSL hydrolase family protein [Bacteroidales bacterium]|nr:SGNH/GDSL hydrolase family protein [Bacteroidales bacterium]